MQKVRAEINLKNIQYNAERFCALHQTRLCAVVKANAYGHGAEEVVNALSGIADCFAVALVEEAIAIRAAACGKKILVFTPPTDEEEGFLLASNGLIATIPDLSTARQLSALCKQYQLPLEVHLKMNTGMNRYGMNASMLGKVCKFLQADPFVRVTGIYSHLYSTNPVACEKQRSIFAEQVTVCKRYFPTVIAHLGGTYGAMLGEKFAVDMLRIGIGLYGYLPCKEPTVTQTLHLRKGMIVYAKAVATRKYSFGGIGYGSVSANKGERLTIYRFGYADGVLRRKQNGADGWQKNTNRACMDVSIRRGTVLRGRWVPILTDAEETARRTGTIAYEVLCAATRRAEFIYK